ncbi:hypothetical protein XA68_15366 [Ophiocordyceps unilateralis]|uniref:Uncharacterized protein n=1 Tax=Ophiocordyceps unilateralis TaxID=268505 RepID=A0A2A9PMC3_OPHUN|nr:hypothetical protein XA68_15366 [Ophiocordyceps unilateralis]
MCPTCDDNQAAIGSHVSDNEFAIDDCSCDDKVKPRMGLLSFRRATPQAGQQRRQSLLTLMLETKRRSNSTPDESTSHVPSCNNQDTPNTNEGEGRNPSSVSPQTTRRGTAHTESTRLGVSTADNTKHGQRQDDSVTLRQLPYKPYMKASEDAKELNRCIIEEAPKDYHSRGW